MSECKKFQTMAFHYLFQSCRDGFRGKSRTFFNPERAKSYIAYLKNVF